MMERATLRKHKSKGDEEDKKSSSKKHGKSSEDKKKTKKKKGGEGKTWKPMPVTTAKVQEQEHESEEETSKDKREENREKEEKEEKRDTRDDTLKRKKKHHSKEGEENGKSEGKEQKSNDKDEKEDEEGRKEVKKTKAKISEARAKSKREEEEGKDAEDEKPKEKHKKKKGHSKKVSDSGSGSGKGEGPKRENGEKKAKAKAKREEAGDDDKDADSDESESKGPRPRRSLAVSESKKHEQIAAEASNVVADSRALDVSNKGFMADLFSAQDVLDATLQPSSTRLEYLFERSVELNQFNDNGYSPLHWALVNGKLQNVKWLLEHGVNPNQKDNLGWTPLHYAANGNSSSVLKLLIEYGGDPSMKTYKKQTVKDIAKGKKQMLEVLKEASKKPLAEVKLAVPQNSSGVSAGDRLASPRKSEEMSKEEIDYRKKLADVQELEKKLYVKAKELKEMEESVNSREGFVAARERTLTQSEQKVKLREQEATVREAACSKLEEDHRVNSISAAVQIVRFKDISLLEKLGSGGFATVWLARWRGDKVAVKVIEKQSEDAAFIKSFQQEAAVLSQLRHGNIIQLMGVCLKYPNLSLVMELMTNGTVDDFIHKNKSKDKASLFLRIAKDTARGMNYLHRMKPPLIHRDLKPLNLMLDESMRVKVVDLGLVRSKARIYVEDMNNNFAGSPAYMAPECLREESYDEKCDVWSFGVMLWEMILEQKPWHGKNRMEVVALVGYNREHLPAISSSSIPDGCPSELAQMVISCCHDEPKGRPSFGKILVKLEHLESDSNK